MEEVRRNYGRASGRLFDMCYSIQKTGELPDPEEISNALATFLEARAMAEFLEEMHALQERHRQVTAEFEVHMRDCHKAGEAVREMAFAAGVPVPK